MNEKIKQLVIKAVRDCGEIDDNAQLAAAGEDTPLFGGDGLLDSAGVVFLVTEIEESVHVQFAASISLVSDSAFGRASSPFRTVRTLAEYVTELTDAACPLA